MSDGVAMCDMVMLRYMHYAYVVLRRGLHHDGVILTCASACDQKQNVPVLHSTVSYMDHTRVSTVIQRVHTGRVHGCT